MNETLPPAEVIVGVDTHKHIHAAVAVNALGARLGAMTIPVRAEGYRDMVAWARALGTIRGHCQVGRPWPERRGWARLAG